MRWLILVYANLICLGVVYGIPREDVVLRTYATVIPATAALVAYLVTKYRRPVLAADTLTTLGVVVQFLLPSLYLVVVRLEGRYANGMGPYLPYLPEVALAALLGQSLFFVGHEMATPRRAGGLSESSATVVPIAHPWRLARSLLPLIAAVWICRIMLLRLGAYYHLRTTRFIFDSPYYSVLTQVGSLGIYVIAAFWLQVFAARDAAAHRKWFKVALGLTASEVLWYFPAGAREPVISIGIALLFAYVHIRKVIPVKWLTAGIGAAVLLIVFMDFYRYSIARYTEPTTIQVSAVATAIDESRQSLLDEDDEVGDWITRVVARLADSRSIAAIIKKVPNEIPYAAGDSYYRIPWVVVPRFLYPGKPQMILPISRYGIFSGEGGSSPTTLIGEAYMNFGWPGLFLVLPLVGAICGLYDRSFSTRRSSPLWAAVFVGTAVGIARLPTQTAGIWIGVLLKAYLVAGLLSFRSRTQDSWEPSAPRPSAVRY